MVETIFEHNLAAIQCYKACGFKEMVPPQIDTFSVLGETWNSIQMELIKKES